MTHVRGGCNRARIRRDDKNGETKCYRICCSLTEIRK